MCYLKGGGEPAVKTLKKKFDHIKRVRHTRTQGG